MMTLRKMWVYLAVLMLSIMLVGCGGKSESDAKADVDKIWAIYSEYYATLGNNKDNPAKGIKEGQAFVDAKKDELAALAASLNSNPNAMKVLQNFQSDMVARGEEEGKKWGASYSQAGLTDKIQAQMMQFADAMDGSASATGGKAPAEVIDQMVAQALESLKMQKDTLKMIPEANRADALKPFMESLKAAGATDEQVSGFESKAKEELGW